jgi:hypothetical protein
MLGFIMTEGDRLVHHALILEIQAESFRQQAAKERSAISQQNRPK